MSLDASPGGFARDEPLVSVPSEIAVMADIIRRMIPDPKLIESNCARINRRVGAVGKEAARLFQRVVQYWAEDDFQLAVEAAEFASRKIGRNPDVWCLLGRACLKLEEPEAGKADVALRKAAAAEGFYLRGAAVLRKAFVEHRARGQVEPLVALKSDLVVAYANSVARRE